MKKYTKPTAQVVELSVKESISLIGYKEKMFGFQGKDLKLRTYANAPESKIDVQGDLVG